MGMKLFKKFGFPAKFTIIFALSIYLPLILAGYYSFNLAKKTETDFGLKIYSQLADLEIQSLESQLDRIKSELSILAKSSTIENILKIHEENPSLGSKELMKLPKYQDRVAEIHERIELIRKANKNIFGIALYVGEENVIAINENKATHDVTFGKNVPIPVELLDEYKESLKKIKEGILFRDSVFLSPLGEKTMDMLDADLVYKGFSNSPKKIPFLITFFNNPFIGMRKGLFKMEVNRTEPFSVILKEKKDGKITGYNDASKYHPIIKLALSGLPESFLNKNNSEFIDPKGNIYTIRKTSLDIQNVDKVIILSFYPAKIIQKPFKDAKNLILKILVGCCFLILPLLFFSLRSIISGFREITLNLKKTSDTLEYSTNEIQEASSIITKSNDENLNLVNEISRAMDQLILANQDFKKEILEMNSLSNITTSSAREGRNDLKDLGFSMEKIIESSKNISKIVRTVENISMQTSVLSMNASIEAARAGEQGAGFSIVAKGIRDLAKESADITAQIGKQIAESIQSIQLGSNKVNQNRTKFTDIIENIENVNQTVEKSVVQLNIRTEEFIKIGIELKKINTAVSEASSQIEKNREIALKLSKESDSLKQSIDKIITLVEGN